MFPETISPAERELMQRAQRVHADFRNKGYSRPGTLLACEFGYLHGHQAGFAEGYAAATKRANNVAGSTDG